MRFQSYINTATKILVLYGGNVPLSAFLKQHFSEHKKYGSKDRKFITHLCYSYFRIGHALKEMSVEERLKIGLFLCTSQAGEWSVLYDDGWLNNWSEEVTERIEFIQRKYSFNVENIFPWQGALSEGINFYKFCLSHLIQPDLFLRIRPNKKKIVLGKLRDASVSFTAETETCLSVKNTTKIDEILQVNKEVVVQDFSSQGISEFFKLIDSKEKGNSSITVWDCCAASGGKAILAADIFQHLSLTVSDIRPSIIKNLEKRFTEAGIKNFTSFTADLTKPFSSSKKYKLVIADVPCSGSGTWSRTPEQLFFFNEERINYYSNLQRNIVDNVVKQVDKNGHLLYITCSVFHAENEAIVSYIQSRFRLKLIKKELLKGYDQKADTMFAALFINSPAIAEISNTKFVS